MVNTRLPPFAFFQINLLLQGMAILYINNAINNLLIVYFQYVIERSMPNIPKRKLKTKLDEALTLPYGVDRCTRNLADVP